VRGSHSKSPKVSRRIFCPDLGGGGKIPWWNPDRERVRIHVGQQAPPKRGSIAGALLVSSQRDEASAREACSSTDCRQNGYAFSEGADALTSRKLEQQRLSAGNSHHLGPLHRAGVTATQMSVEPKAGPRRA
jgi:hypothetical protein